ncbi:hypothetical protein [Methylobacter sp. S3L5C]|uniref:S53 family peptidase n=1 Tax=Methylobacter sp. S3L5C TaxID=2839024 RepID=UPI001FAD2299|nr:hypothetical protein [Methylobacter sp. S3L5C]UOA08262.1 hypothetical protein KKZ03_18970 [Methylobacter sp. S3L5C]
MACNPLYAASVKGSGVTIAVIGRSNIVPGDIATFQSFSGLPSNPIQTIINGPDPDLVNGDQMESSLDVEWASGIAPSATEKFITSASTTTADGIQLSAQYAVSNNIGDIISLSYGSCEKSISRSGVNYWSSLWQQAQTQGQTVLVSSGDSGVAGCDISSQATAVGGAGVNGLCSSPYSTCVGGTQFNNTSNPSLYWQSSGTVSALSYIPETVWNESGSNLYASGGGKSRYLSKPVWQVSPGVPVDNARYVPDVSQSASGHDGYIIYVSGSQ